MRFAGLDRGSQCRSGAKYGSCPIQSLSSRGRCGPRGVRPRAGPACAAGTVVRVEKPLQRPQYPNGICAARESGALRWPRRGFVGLVLGNIACPPCSCSPPPRAGTGANIGISAVAAATASIAHIRAGRVNWRCSGGCSALDPGSAGRGYVRECYRGLCCSLIAAVLLYSGIELLRSRKRSPRPEGQEDLDIPARSSRLVIGVLGGIVGLILGSLRMPAWSRSWVRLRPARWAPTSDRVPRRRGWRDRAPAVPNRRLGRPCGGAAASIPGALWDRG